MNLTCPKCQGQMRTYERNGVHVDQCADCRGIFLDRGELEQLVDAESRWSTPPAAQAAPPQQPQQPQGGAVAPPPGRRFFGSDDSPDDYRGGQQQGYQQGYGKPKKKRGRSFLEDLFEG